MDHASDGDAENNPALPITDVTVEEIERFCEKMSKWLGDQSSFTLKSVSGRPGRVGLPTLSEWQFAACGGVQTFGTPLFNERWPWGGPVTPREWHSGPASSSGELRKIGVLEPHPLGLFDVLGNARELAANDGQHWMVGCDYATADTEFTVFSNEQIPRLMPNSNRAFQQPEVGFRLVLSADADAFQQGQTEDK
jgi:formylglycine-generating enzyme required for sulfatase activity